MGWFPPTDPGVLVISCLWAVSHFPYNNLEPVFKFVIGVDLGISRSQTDDDLSASQRSGKKGNYLNPFLSTFRKHRLDVRLCVLRS